MGTNHRGISGRGGAIGRGIRTTKRKAPAAKRKAPRYDAHTPVKHAVRRPRREQNIESYLRRIVEVSERVGSNTMTARNADGTYDLQVYALGGTDEDLLTWEVETEGRVNGDSLWLQAGLYRDKRDNDAASRNKYQSLDLHTVIQWASPTIWGKRGGGLELVREWLRTYPDAIGWTVRVWYDPTPGEFPWHWREAYDRAA